MKKLALLDFDGTIYRGDSMRDFARFLHPVRYLFSLLVLSGPATFSLFGMVKRDSIKSIFLQLNFKGYSKSELTRKGQEFFDQHKERCYKKANEWIAQHKHDTRMVIVSGSCHPWLEPFSKELGIELICTELMFDADNKSMGRWVHYNVIGKRKVDAVKENIDIAEYKEVIAFGNEKRDAHLSEIATSFHLNFFRA